MSQRKLPIHIILDNYGTHKHPAVRRWFTAHPRYHVHFTPTGASWLNHAPNPEVRLRSLLGIIPQLETHHGEVEGDELVFPNGFVFEVIGLGLADNVADALREFGFTSFVETPEDFKPANKPASDHRRVMRRSGSYKETSETGDYYLRQCQKPSPCLARPSLTIVSSQSSVAAEWVWSRRPRTLNRAASLR